MVPGQRMDVKALSSALQVSIQPIKEALNRLELEGVVVIKPRIGTFVRNLTLEDVNNILDCRLMIEEFAVSRLTDLPEGILEEMRQAEQYMRNCVNSDPFPYHDYNEGDICFHEALVKIAGNAELFRLYRSLHSHYLTEWAYFSFAWQKAMSNDVDHDLILHAIASKDEETARRLVGKHIRSAQRGLKEAFTR